MNCKKCGFLCPKDTKFCPNCGSKIVNVNFRKIFLIIIPIVIIGLSGLLILNYFKNQDNGYGTKSFIKNVAYHYNGNLPKYIDGSFSDEKVANKSDAKKVLKNLLKVDGENDLEFISKNKNSDISSYRFNQTYKSIVVYNQNVILSVDKNGNILGFSGYYIPDVTVDINPKISENEAINIVKEKLGEGSNVLKNQLAILAENSSFKLVYIISGYSFNELKEYTISAIDGQILKEIIPVDFIATELEGLDKKKFTIDIENYDVMGEKYYNFYDKERKISLADVRGTSQITSLVTALPRSNAYDVSETVIKDDVFSKAAVSSMAYFEKIYDYYKTVLNRNSYDNEGSPIIVNLGVKNSLLLGGGELDNAYWSSITNQMYIGEYNGKYFSASLDVLAHEFTHGVNQSIVNFAKTPKDEDKNKAFESRALDEAYADILGSLIEGKNWTIAEDNEILRDLTNPNAYESPSEVGGQYYFPDGYIRENETLTDCLKRNNLETAFDYDNGGVHQNANVVGHAAYLMESYGAFKNKEEMAKVWYQSLFYLSSYSKFEDCALSVIQAAKNLGLSNDSIAKITKAFVETKMLNNDKNILKGTVTSGEKLLGDVAIEIYAYGEDKLIASTTTDIFGNYQLNLTSGAYKIVVKKDDFKEFNDIVIVDGEITYDIELARDIKKNIVENNSSTFNYNCKNHCVTIKMCYNFDMYNNVDANCNELKVEKGSTLDAQKVVDIFNNNLNSIEGLGDYVPTMTTDGENFYIDLAGLKMKFAWYYKGQKTKFAWNKPITDDAEIEMNYNEQDLFGNDTYEDVQDLLEYFK